MGGRVLILDYENHGSEWARRINSLAGAAALEDVSWVAPLTEGLGAIWTHAEAIRDYVLANDITFLVVDSAAFACAGEDPSKAETAIRYGAALQVIGVPSLTLAHVTKLHDARYPFGSAFWHNAIRVSWSLMPKGEELVLVCRKANNYRKPSAQAVELTWYEDALREVIEKPAAWSLEDRIAEVLAHGPLTPLAIAAALNDGLAPGEQTTAATVRATLSRGLSKHGATYRFTVADGSWRLRAAGD
jgi:hypothetical protein